MKPGLNAGDPLLTRHVFTYGTGVLVMGLSAYDLQVLDRYGEVEAGVSAAGQQLVASTAR